MEIKMSLIKLLDEYQAEIICIHNGSFAHIPVKLAVSISNNKEYEIIKKDSTRFYPNIKLSDIVKAINNKYITLSNRRLLVIKGVENTVNKGSLLTKVKKNKVINSVDIDNKTNEILQFIESTNKNVRHINQSIQ